MDIKKYMKIVPAVAVLLLTSACNQNLELVEDAQPRIIPYTVSAVSDVETRATLFEEFGGYYYQFQTGDKLYVWGENINGELTLQTTTNNSMEATFSGNLNWSGLGDPADDLSLNAVLVGPNDMLFGTPEDFFGVVYENDYKPDYTAGLAYSYAEAVENFSYLRTESTYGAKSFNFYNRQSTAFVSFVITLEDGTAGETSLDVSIDNHGGVISAGNVMTSEDEGVVTASFIAPVLGPTELEGAKVVLSTGVGDERIDREISFGGTATLWGNTVYNVKKTYTEYSITASATIPELGAKSKKSDNKPMGYTTTLSDLLNEMGAGSAASMVTGCTRTSGSSVDVTAVGTDYQFTLVDEGTSVFDMVVTMVGTIPVTITVAKMTPEP